MLSPRRPRRRLTIHAPPPLTVRVDWPPPERLDHLDGLRGLAALYVVAFHAADWTTWDARPDDRPFAALTLALAHGHAAVGVFIVLSGYSLMRPVVRSGGVLAGGVRGYLRRRARRILPPYFAATVLSLALIAAVPMLGRPSGTSWDHCLPAFRGRTLLYHALLIHNLDLRHLLKINAPHWSVATEWQIYFALPLLLLPIWRRLGTAATVLVAFGLGVLPHLTLPPRRNFDTACPWYLGLFALGMAAAVVERSPRRGAVPWRTLATAGAVGLVFVLLNRRLVVPGSDRSPFEQTVRFLYWGRPIWVWDAWVGLVTALGLVALAREAEEGRRSIVGKVLVSRPLLALGAVSYSLYLTHYPALALVHGGVLAGGRTSADLLRLLALGLPLALVLAIGFHWLAERPFLGARGRPSRVAWPRPRGHVFVRGPRPAVHGHADEAMPPGDEIVRR